MSFSAKHVTDQISDKVEISVQELVAKNSVVILAWLGNMSYKHHQILSTAIWPTFFPSAWILAFGQKTVENKKKTPHARLPV